MRINNYVVVLCALSLPGCFSSSIEVKDIDEKELNNYPTLIGQSGTAEDKLYTSAWRDLMEASNRCRNIHNNYEKNAKQAEQGKLLLATGGGVAGLTGATLIAAGASSVVGGIASGLAGVVSLILGSSEKGPLGTSYYMTQKQGIALNIQNAVKEAQNTSDPKKIYAIATGLAMSCLAAESELKSEQ